MKDTNYNGGEKYFSKTSKVGEAAAIIYSYA
jgi:hypothetical protein